MALLTQWVPDSWREALSHVRQDIHRNLDHWLHRQPSAPDAQRAELVPQPLEIGRHRDANWSPLTLATWAPGLDLEETDDTLLVTAELPGLDRDDFTVEVTGERLVIRGEKQQASTRNDQGYTYTERRYSAVARAMRLPCEVDTGQAQATYQNGVLRLTLPKIARAKASRVKIQVRG